MSEPTSALLSVRGEARATVAADSAVINGVLRATQDTKAEALEAVAVGLRGLTGELGGLGGVPLNVDSRDQPLTWSAYSATTELEHEDDEQGRYRRTGRVIASVAVQLVVRSFDLLDRLSAVLATHDAFSIHHVAWEVDADNSSWPEVRAAAIQAAIDKGRDYAAALGGSLDRVEHIADVGLLGGETTTARAAVALSGRGFRSAGLPDTPSLDPVPQELIAVIDARFIAAVAAL
ncbi:MAG TPA: SIMPL domain-containing protein [Jatrophihabitantaceae bacterium]|jgi:uncharacterized protein YggE